MPPAPVPAAATAPGAVAEADEVTDLADESATQARAYVTTVTEIASGSSPDIAMPMLLLATAQLLLAGSRLGAIQDVVLDERFEPDPGPDADVEPLRDNLANLFEGIDDYADLVDPVTQAELTKGSLSNDMTEICLALAHGLSHYDAGRRVEALWWWQFSYLSTWGERAAASLRVLQSILAHLRLDADEDTVADAEFDALHP
ncbi:MAG: DUF5063 domain-containing protein [Actinomycetales bacterium]|jgi:hypothetical protein|nr:DUF5063 domain-containing protein [Candidatus Phosphoribacter baldrii]MBK6955996.1 DUF5063 domain-containing protein [Candidatus Phosphoribacter baldrii]